MLEMIRETLAKARRRGVSALAVAALAILPVVLCGCKGQRETPSSDNASQQRAAAVDVVTIEDLEQIAEKLVFVDTGELLYGHDKPSTCLGPPPEDNPLARSGTHVIELLSTSMSGDALLDLLRHEDPRIRALAIGAIFAQGDPSALPSVAKLRDDNARTFPLFSMMYSRRHYPDPRGTVGSVATAVVMAYLGAVPVPADQSEPGWTFDTYWATHGDLPHCASWFRVRLNWAAGNRKPTPPDRVDHVRQVRQEIDAIPADDRVWTLLWLHGGTGSDQLVSEEELIVLCQQLGPDKLIQMLRDEIPSKDPTFQAWRSGVSWPYQRMSLFVLQHADELLRPSDVQALLACEELHRSNRTRQHGRGAHFDTPWWAIAAAHLKPADAVGILRQAIGRFDRAYDQGRRLALATALWQMAGPEELTSIIDWFFDEPFEAQYRDCRARFVGVISSEDTQLARRALAAIIRDPRFDGVDWPTLRAVVIAVNQWTQPPVVSEEELQRVSLPVSARVFYDEQSEWVARRFPEETASVYSAIANWRERLRVSLPQWAPSDDE